MVIGAGVVGLAIARELSMAGREVVIAERGERFGEGTSARNSEVIHAGLYYPPGSLKANLCVDGRRRLYEYCAQRGVAHRRCGKLIVAAVARQTSELEKIEHRARAAGVDDLRWLTGAQATALEPALVCHGALISPSTGIVDSHGLMLALLGEAEEHGAMLAVMSEARSVEPVAGGFHGRLSSDGGPPWSTVTGRPNLPLLGFFGSDFSAATGFCLLKPDSVSVSFGIAGSG